GQLRRDMPLVLVNAVYLKAMWAEPFEKSQTKSAPFRVSDKKCVTAKLMQNIGVFPYFRDEHCELVALPYEGNWLEAVFVLPSNAGITELTDGLTIQHFEDIRRKAELALVSVQIPCFRFEWGADLSSTLTALGLEAAFEPERADFSAMADHP